MSTIEVKTRLKELYAKNRKSLRTSEHLAITKEIMKLKNMLN